MDRSPVLENIIESGTLRSIRFEFMTGRDIENFGSASIEDISDLTCSKLGVPNPSSECETCGSSTVENCHGHSGCIKLPTVIYHPYFVTEIVHILNQICPGCKSVRHLQMKRLRKSSHRLEPNTSQRGCKYCSKQRDSEQWYPKMKFKVVRDKLASKNLAIVVEVNERLPKKFKNMTPSEALAKDYWNFVPCELDQPELYCSVAMNLSPSQAFYMLKQLDKDFIENYVPRRELLFLSSIPVTSNGHRVTERILPHINGPELVFDQRSKAYKSLLSSKRKVDDLQVHHHPFGGGISKAIGNLAYNCLNSSNLHLTSSMNKDHSPKLSGLKWIKDVVLGKRSDHTFSMVVVGDPKIKLWEIGIPQCVADRLVVTGNVTSFKKDKSSQLNLHFSCRKENFMSKTYDQDNTSASQKRDALYRSLQDGDLVLINRPPSVHHHSLIAFSVKILPTKSVISINPLCCAPFKGDFDGDFLLGYIPQSIQSRVELGQLVSIEHQLFDGQDGKNLLSLTHDSLTATYLLTQPDVFLDRFQMQQLQMLCPRQIDSPAIFCPTSSKKQFWTGRQLFSSLLPPSFDFFASSEEVLISKGEILHTTTDSSWLQNTKTSVFSSLFKCCGRNALQYLFAVQDVLCEWISCRGFSVTLNDLYLCSDQYSRNKLMDEVNCGLQDAKDAFHIKSVMMDPEICYLVCMGHRRDCSRCSDQQSQFKNKCTAELKIGSGLKGSENAHNIKSIMMDPEISLLLNNCYWYHDLAGPRHLIKCNCYKDLSRTCHQRDRNRNTKLKSEFTKEHTAAATAFKEVFQDLQAITHHFARRDNSLLQMIHAGSKGSFSKLFQQSVCVGFQHVSSFSFLQMSSKFDFATWNPQKFSDALGAVSVAAELGRNNPCTAVQSSFLDGLNPSECLLHATSARANSFSTNAELPGTLNRNLMFMMRDLYLAYDGTVRSCYGQQIVQFTYDIFEDQDTSCIQLQEPCKLRTLKNSEGLYGSSVGALASCSISEAAYGGLEQPSSSLESSPLVNLKKLLSGSHKHAPQKRMVSLALSRKLKRWNYGFEYAALQVQHHLERVLLSDVVNAILIVYSGKEVEASFSPWVIHLHLNKNIMSKKRVTTRQIIDIIKNYKNSSMLDLEDSIDKIQELHVLSWKCQEMDRDEEDENMVCLMVAAKTCFHTRGLDEVRDIIPALLQSVIKGFSEYPKVDILCDERTNLPRLQKGCPGELFLKVTILSSWKTKRFWANLQDACLPVRELIDWERSVPDNVRDFSASHGIGSAWNYFLENLKAATNDLGRNIHERHLHLVADCFTATGQIRGLTSKGIKNQRKHSGISSPFIQACFVRPARALIDAAKEGAEDQLIGTVDALAWGKEVPIGTGALFDIMYPKMVPTLDKPENVYEALINQAATRMHDDIPSTRTSLSDKWKGSLKAFGFQKMPLKSVSSNTKQERTVACDFMQRASQMNPISEPKMLLEHMRGHLRKILNSNPIDSSLSDDEASYVMEALTFHPRSKEKIGCGVKKIKIGCHPLHQESRCFMLVREDGTTEDFSYIKCVIGAAKRNST